VKPPGPDGPIVSAAVTPAAWRRQEDALTERITSLHAAVSQALGGEPNALVLDRVTAGDLAAAVAALTAWCTGRLTAVSVLPPELSPPGMPQPHPAMSGGLGPGDGAATSSAQLVDQACEHLVRGCGFGRAVLSRVESLTWRPWMAHFTPVTGEATWFSDWVDRPIPLDDLVVETEVLTGRRPVAVLDTEASHVYRPIIVDAGHSSSYVVAPVVLAGQVAGFFHADYAAARRRSGPIDPDRIPAGRQGALRRHRGARRRGQ
jgi:hypothetical protein